MFLEDILDGGQLIVNDDEYIGSRFGNLNQLRIVGLHWKYKPSGKRGRFYIAICDICAEDPELFGEGYFSISRYSMQNGQLPCGCSKVPKWTEEQFIIRMKRAASLKGNTFIGWSSDYKGVYTRAVVSCPVHGEWETTPMTLVNMGSGCLRCVRPELGRTTGNANRKPDEMYLSKFIQTGAYPDGTKFSRVYRDVGGIRKLLWKVECPECSGVFYSTTMYLREGRKSCSCNSTLPTGAYILVINDADLPVGVKFGITKDFPTRLYQIRRKTLYDVLVVGFWEFLNPVDCRAAELRCKQELITCVLDKISFPDGYSETTYVYNIDKIIAIYESYGGTKLTITEGE